MKASIVRRQLIDDSHLPQHLHPVVKQIYARRGVKSADELVLSAQQLIPPSQLFGADQACDVLLDALAQQNKIIIVGDFDADGATSTALMMEALRLLGFRNHQFLVPNRFDYGYGLSPEIVEVAAKQGAELIITVDNGISCIAGVSRAKALGIKVIVTDHHLPGQTLPDADAIVNPNQGECTFASKALAGVGVAFYLMLALRQRLRQMNWFEQSGIAEPNLAQLLDLVALGTVADVVTLDANNRILVAQGLKRIQAGQTRPGIQALIEVAKRNQDRLSASDFGFALGPRINAAGRLDDISYGINCLLEPNIMAARAMAQELDQLNRARREIEQGMQVEAEQILSRLNLAAANDDSIEIPKAIALFHPEWHQGVIGIVAGRIKEKFHRPCIVFAVASDEQPLTDDSEIKGSARSIVGLHIRDLLEQVDSRHPDLISKFGGHAMAAGLTIKKANFKRFEQAFSEVANEWLNDDQLQGKIYSDGSLSSRELTLDFAELLRASGPWGQHFEEPVFDDIFTVVQQRLVGEKHLKLVVQKDGLTLDAIAFNIDLKAWPNHSAERIRLAYKLDVNEFRGKHNLQLMIEHIELA